MKLKRKYLKNEEILKIDIFRHETIEIENEIAKKKLNIEILKLKIENMENEIYKLRVAKQNKINSGKNYTKEIEKLCGIKTDKWGYDPESGEIKL